MFLASTNRLCSVDTAVGRLGESACRALLEGFGCEVRDVTSLVEQFEGYDLWVRPPFGRTYSVQCKYDAASKRTGRLFVETGTIDGLGRARMSGISTCAADIVMYVLPGRGILEAPPARLLAFVDRASRISARSVCSRVNRRGAESWYAVGVVVLIDELLATNGAYSAWYPQ